MDVLFGGLLAILLLAVCVGFGLAVCAVVTGLFGGSDRDERDPTDRQ